MDMPEVVEFFKEERKKQGVKLEYLSAVCGVRSGTSSRIETGKTPEPRFSTIQALLEPLGYKLELKIEKL